MMDDDRFELELVGLRPRGPSAELRRRIAEDLAAAPRSNVVATRYARQKAALVGGLLAASLVAVIIWRGGRERAELQSIAPLEANVATAFDKSIPSLWSYRNGLTNSSHTLDQLLDKYAVQSVELKSGGAPDSVFGRFNSDVDSLLGEL